MMSPVPPNYLKFWEFIHSCGSQVTLTVDNKDFPQTKIFWGDHVENLNNNVPLWHKYITDCSGQKYILKSHANTTFKITNDSPRMDGKYAQVKRPKPRPTPTPTPTAPPVPTPTPTVPTPTPTPIIIP